MRRTSIHALILITSLALPSCQDLEGFPPPARPLDLLSSSDREALLDWILESRKQHPDFFFALQDLVAEAPQMAARSHAGVVSFAFHLGQEPRFLAPALELLVVAEPPLDQLSDHYWAQVRHNLIFAVGLMRDSRSLPSLVALLRIEDDAPTAHVIAESIARLESDQALEILLGLADDQDQPEWFRHAVLTGLGAARREIAAKRLATELYKHPPPEFARQLLTALGKTGNSVGWSTSNPHANEEQLTRTTASNAALWAFLEYHSDPVANEAKIALYVSSYPETLTRIGRLRSAIDENQRPRLDKLHDDLQRFLKDTGRLPGT